MKEEHPVLAKGVDHAVWRRHVDLLVKCGVEECAVAVCAVKVGPILTAVARSTLKAVAVATGAAEKK